MPEHDPEKWIPVFGKAHAPLKCCGRSSMGSSMMTRVCFVIGLAMLAGGTTTLLAQDDRLRTALDNLVAAYPSALPGHDDKVLRWRDGTVMPVSDGTASKPFEELLRHASIA